MPEPLPLPCTTQKSNTVERFHRSMKRKLTALIHEFDDEWDEALPATLLAMRTSVNGTTGFTLFYLEHGREAGLPVDMIAGPPPAQSDNLDRYTDKIRNQFAKAFSVVAERQNAYILRQKVNTRSTSMTLYGSTPIEPTLASTENFNPFGLGLTKLSSKSPTLFLKSNHIEGGRRTR